MAEIQQFKDKLKGGGARANQFKVTVSFPSIATGDSVNKAIGDIEFLCNSASLPGSFIGVANTFYRGRQIKLAGERVFQDWQINVLNDTTFDIRNSFEKWMQAINSSEYATGTTAYQSYTAQLVVQQLSRNGSVLKEYKFVDAWPTTIGDIQLNFGANDQIEEFPVTFAYSHWTANTSVGLSVATQTPFGELVISA